MSSIQSPDSGFAVQRSFRPAQPQGVRSVRSGRQKTYEYAKFLEKKGHKVPDISLAGGLAREDHLLKAIALGAPFTKLACMGRAPMIQGCLGSNIEGVLKPERWSAVTVLEPAEVLAQIDTWVRLSTERQEAHRRARAANADRRHARRAAAVGSEYTPHRAGTSLVSC